MHAQYVVQKHQIAIDAAAVYCNTNWLPPDVQRAIETKTCMPTQPQTALYTDLGQGRLKISESD